MAKPFLALHKTGWFYLLLVLWCASYWFVSEGGFNQLNQLNRKKLYQTLTLATVKPEVAHLSASLHENDFNQIAELLASYIDTPVVIIGSSSNQFNQLLQSYLLTNPRGAKVIMATEGISSAHGIENTDSNPSVIERVINWFRHSSSPPIQWRTSSEIIYAPLMRNKNGSLSLVWRDNTKSYLSLMGEIIRQTRINHAAQINSGWNIELIAKHSRWPLGANGAVYSTGSAGALFLAKPLQEFLLETKHATPELIILDDHSHPHINSIISTTGRLLEHHYLYQSLSVKILELFLLLLGLLILWFIRAIKMRFQSIVVIGFVASLWLVQYLIFTQMQWLEVNSSVIILLLSWMILSAYQRETRFFSGLNERYNLLLGKSLPVFYQSKKMEEISLFLEQTRPDLKLFEIVYELALEAEKNHKKEPLKYFISWLELANIQSAGINKKIKALKLASKKSLPVPSNPVEGGLDQTMVITSGQKVQPTFLNSIYNIKNFGRYQVEGILGKGAMGIVYQGVDPKINRHVAIKTLQLSDDASAESFEETKQRFFREAETAGNLSHANIVTIYDVGEEGELGYIAMDLLTGAPLSEFNKPESVLPIPLVYQLMIQITDALDYAHKQNVVHRDIKPGNMIYDDDLQRVTITDFGIAYVADNSKTRTGMIMGSPYYMSPEQVLGVQVDGRSDIFSLGVTLYQLLCGYLPFEGESMASVVYQITNSKHAYIKKWNAKLPTSATRITNKAMHKDINKRYQSMVEFKMALIKALKNDFNKVPMI